MRSVVLVGLAGFVLVDMACAASVTSVAHDTFLRDHGDCASADENVVNDDWMSIVEVVGCGHRAQYSCTPGGSDHHGNVTPTACAVRARLSLAATDGTSLEAWAGDDETAPEIARRSAIHDIPCPRESVKTVDKLTLEGCGQRVTYRQVAVDVAVIPSTQGFRLTDAARYILVGRVSLSPSTTTPTP